MNLPTKRADRLPEIALAGSVFTLFVLIIHTLSVYISSGADGWLYNIISTGWRLCGCATYGFVFLAGLRFTLSAKRKGDAFRTGSYLLSRLKRLLPLYLLAVVVYYLWNLSAARAGVSAPEATTFSLSELLFGFLTGNTAAHLYFVPILLQFTLLAPLSLRLRKRYPAWLLLPVSLLLTVCFGHHITDYTNALFPNLPQFAYGDRVFFPYLIYWTAGCSAGDRYEAFGDFLDKNRGAVTVLFGFSALLDLGSIYSSHSLGRLIWCLEQTKLLYCLSAILFVLMLARAVTARRALPRFLSAFDRAGYPVYLAHLIAILAAQVGIERLGIGALWGVPLRFAAVLLCCAAVTVLNELWRKIRSK